MPILLNGIFLRHNRKETAPAVLVKMYSQLSEDQFLHSLLFNDIIIARHASFAFTYCRGCRPESQGEKGMAFYFPSLAYRGGWQGDELVKTRSTEEDHTDSKALKRTLEG